MHPRAVAPSLVAIARERVHDAGVGKPEFCAASAANLSFIPDNSFDHAVCFAVMMYVADTSEACKMASELVRITKPGGVVFIGQANDPDVAAHRPAGHKSEGYWQVPRWFWYKFAYERGLRVQLVGGEEVYSKRTLPLLRHYDLHAYMRYNVYLEKPAADEAWAAGGSEVSASAEGGRGGRGKHSGPAMAGAEGTSGDGGARLGAGGLAGSSIAGRGTCVAIRLRCLCGGSTRWQGLPRRWHAIAGALAATARDGRGSCAIERDSRGPRGDSAR